jgi:DNA-binding HxlR family transcriptional regulator
MQAAHRSPPHARCDFDATMALLGERHVLAVLYALFQKSPRGFNELKAEAEVNPATLSDRLKRLERLGIVERTVIRVLPRRVEYGISPMGRDLIEIFRTMTEWRTKYAVAPIPTGRDGSASRARRARGVGGA